MIFDFSTPINTDIYTFEDFYSEAVCEIIESEKTTSIFLYQTSQGWANSYKQKKAQNFQHQMIGPETEDNRVTNYYLLRSHELTEREKSKPLWKEWIQETGCDFVRSRGEAVAVVFLAFLLLTDEDAWRSDSILKEAWEKWDGEEEATGERKEKRPSLVYPNKRRSLW